MDSRVIPPLIPRFRSNHLRARKSHTSGEGRGKYTPLFNLHVQLATGRLGEMIHRLFPMSTKEAPPRPQEDNRRPGPNVTRPIRSYSHPLRRQKSQSKNLVTGTSTTRVMCESHVLPSLKPPASSPKPPPPCPRQRRRRRQPHAPPPPPETHYYCSNSPNRRGCD